MRRKAARLVAAKAVLAARVDACHESVHGEFGLKFKEDIEKKLDKLQEPPPVKFIKPLPKPIEGSKKKRGGKRVRKMKERYALTEFRKQANRMNFGDVSLTTRYKNDKYNIFLIYRLKKMLTKMIWVTHAVLLVKLARDAYVCHKLMKRPKYVSVRPCKRTYKSNRCMVAAQQ